MKWKSHIAIARAVASRLGLDEYIISDAVLLPDKNRAPFESHHKYPYYKIYKHIINARRSLRNNDINEATRYLGIALHFIHDRLTSKFKRIALMFVEEKHDEIEEDLASIPIDYDAIDKGIKDSKSDPMKIMKILKELRAESKPSKIMAKACYISAYIARAVFDDSNYAKIKAKDYKHDALLFLIVSALLFIAYYLGVKPFALDIKPEYLNFFIMHSPLIVAMITSIITIERAIKYRVYKLWLL